MYKKTNGKRTVRLDLSTQSCKLLVVDLDGEEIIYMQSVNYDQDLPQYKTKDGVVRGLRQGVSESDPRMWIDAVHIVFDRLSSSGIPVDRILCISVSGQQHGLVALDAEGNLTRARSKLWNDFSTQEECQILTERVGGKKAMIREVGNSQRTGYTAAKIFHMLRHEKEVYQKTSTFLVVHNYINWYLTGGLNGGIRVMEPGDTSGTALWNPKTGKWSKKVIEALEPGLEAKLPKVNPVDRSIGNISAELVHKYGFSSRCKIDAGSGDNMYGAVGTGNVEPGIVTVSLGTSGTACTILNDPFIDPAGEVAAYCDSTGKFLSLVCVSNLSNGYNQLLKRYKLSHDEFNTLIRKTRPGNKGRLLIPWYAGERTPDLPLASPIYFGFDLEDFSPEVLCRAVLEGHVLNLYQGFQNVPAKAEEIRLTGGLSQSEAWCQAIADIFAAEAIPVKGEGAALGAAIHAAWVWLNEDGKKTTIQELTDRFVTLDEQNRKKPTPSHRDIYDTQKRLFQALSRRILRNDSQDPFKIRAFFPELK
ncbi:xylulokinase [Acidobacteriota bacterium]